MTMIIGIIALVWFLAVLHYVQRTAQILAQILKMLDTIKKSDQN
jgi:hypothetical protein